MKGFTLMEIIVTLGVFGIIMVAGSSFLIDTIRNAGQAKVQNDVRQNASALLQDISRQVRRSYCVYYANPVAGTALLRLADDPNSSSCNLGGRVEYFQNAAGVVTKAATSAAGVQASFGILSANNIAVLDCSSGGTACGAQICAAGLVVNPSGVISGGVPVTVTIRAQQLSSQRRSDYCAAVKLLDTITPRVR